MGVNPLPCTAVCEHHWLHKQFRRFQVSVLMVTLKMIAPSILISLLFTACMCIVTGIRPSSYRPRHLITLMLARQVSATAEIVIVFGCGVIGLYPSALWSSGWAVAVSVRNGSGLDDCLTQQSSRWLNLTLRWL